MCRLYRKEREGLSSEEVSPEREEEVESGFGGWGREEGRKWGGLVEKIEPELGEELADLFARDPGQPSSIGIGIPEPEISPAKSIAKAGNHGEEVTARHLCRLQGDKEASFRSKMVSLGVGRRQDFRGRERVVLDRETGSENGIENGVFFGPATAPQKIPKWSPKTALADTPQKVPQVASEQATARRQNEARAGSEIRQPETPGTEKTRLAFICAGSKARGTTKYGATRTASGSANSTSRGES